MNRAEAPKLLGLLSSPSSFFSLLSLFMGAQLREDQPLVFFSLSARCIFLRLRRDRRRSLFVPLAVLWAPVMELCTLMVSPRKLGRPFLPLPFLFGSFFNQWRDVGSGTGMRERKDCLVESPRLRGLGLRERLGAFLLGQPVCALLSAGPGLMERALALLVKDVHVDCLRRGASCCARGPGLIALIASLDLTVRLGGLGLLLLGLLPLQSSFSSAAVVATMERRLLSSFFSFRLMSILLLLVL